jgi:hypothetical protein
MKNLSDSAFVLSVHYDANGVARLNLKWEGRHEISDFDFDHLGHVIGCGTETENAGWVIVRFSQDERFPSLPPESQFGPMIFKSYNPVHIGDSVRFLSSKG